MNFFHSVSLYSIANIIVVGLSFLLIPILTRIIDTEELGLVFIFQALVALIATVASLGGPSVIQSLYHQKPSVIGEYISSAITNSFICTLFLILLTLIFFKNLFLNLGFPLVFTILILSLSFLSFFQTLIQTLLQTREESGTFLVITSLSAFIGFIVSLILLLFYKANWEMRAFGIASAFIVSLMTGAIYLKRIGYAVPDKRKMLEIFLIGYPVIFHSFAMLLINQSDKFLLAQLRSLSEVGQYGVATQFSGVITIFGSTLAAAYAPILYKNISSKNIEKHNEIRKIRKICISVISLFGAVVFILVLRFNKFLLGDNFTFPIVTFLILVGAYICFSWYFLYTGYFYHYKKTKLLAFITGSIAIMNIIISFLLIPYYGLIGASIGTLLSYFLGFLMAFIFSKRIYYKQHIIFKN